MPPDRLGGLNKQARADMRTDRLTTRVWDADDVLDYIFEVYDRLPDELRMGIRLTRTRDRFTDAAVSADLSSVTYHLYDQ